MIFLGLAQLEMINGRENSKSDWYETPNIIRLANEGTKFSNAYFRLFDIKLNDIEEAIDIADANPELVKSLKLELRDYLKEVNSYALKLNPEWSKNNGTKDGDADDDGLDDIWEFRNLLSTQFNGNDGPDNDGFSNEEEETKGGDPLVFNATL